MDFKRLILKQRFGTIFAILLFGFVVGMIVRFLLDNVEERDVANYVRSGLHGAGIALAAWFVQEYFLAQAHTPAGAVLRRMPVSAEVLLRSLAMTVVILIVGTALQAALYARTLQLHWLDSDWFLVHLPLIVAVGLSMSILISTVVEAVRLIGRPMLTSIVLGTYHRPVREERIVMFLDLAESTSLAEKLGELRVHDLITRFFYDIDGPIDDHGGSILSYVGDEVIVTWPLTGDPVLDARCIACFAAIEARMVNLARDYEREFGAVPRFRAGLHAGPVIVSECGGVKRQLAYFGDTMNVAARICEYCKASSCNLLVSGAVFGHVALPQDLTASAGERIALRGREQPLEVYQVEACGS
jgi:adenylate cyclase